jgi:hypothetical protein
MADIAGLAGGPTLSRMTDAVEKGLEERSEQ